MFDDDLFPLTVFLKPSRIAGQYITIGFYCENHTINLRKFCKKLSDLTSKAFGGAEKTLKCGTFYHFGKIIRNTDLKGIEVWSQIKTILETCFNAKVKINKNHYYYNPTELSITFENIDHIQKYLDLMSSNPLETYSHLVFASKFDIIQS
jgi:hypothetical protein